MKNNTTMKTPALLSGNTPAFAPGHQTGAALIVGLILLLILTMLGISGMRTATFELLQAGNTQYAENAFQAAETGIDRAMLSGGLNTALPVVVPETAVAESDGVTFESVTQFAVTTNVPQGLFSVGESGGFQAYHFDINSAGRSSRNARSDHSQSFYVVGPGN